MLQLGFFLHYDISTILSCWYLWPCPPKYQFEFEYRYHKNMFIIKELYSRQSHCEWKLLNRLYCCVLLGVVQSADATVKIHFSKKLPGVVKIRPQCMFIPHSYFNSRNVNAIHPFKRYMEGNAPDTFHSLLSSLFMLFTFASEVPHLSLTFKMADEMLVFMNGPI